MILFADEYMHQEWCWQNSTTTDKIMPGFFNELCIQYILPTLIFT